MDQLDLVAASSRTAISPYLVWIMAGLVFLLGSWLLGQGLWIHIKAMVAQQLLHQAWQETLNTQQAVNPWPWADTWPVGRLQVPRLEVDQIILAHADGESLAFGPGKVGPEVLLRDDTPHVIISGHRDTHFSFMQEVQLGETLMVQTIQGTWHRLEVEQIAVVDSRITKLRTNKGSRNVRLITCYPFEAVIPGGPLRYVVTARPLASKSMSYAEVSARAGGGSMVRGVIAVRG